MSEPPPFDPRPSSEGFKAEMKKTEGGRVERPVADVFSLALTKADRSRGPATALTIDNARASMVGPEHAKMMSGQVAYATAGNDNSSGNDAAGAEMVHRVAQAQIDAAIAQRDAANAQKMTSWTTWVFVPAALFGILVGWLFAKLMGVA